MFDTSERFPTLIGVMVEQIDAPFVFEPVFHVWTKSKRADVTIPDDATQHSEDVM
jgi:hypothetical protein